MQYPPIVLDIDSLLHDLKIGRNYVILGDYFLHVSLLFTPVNQIELPRVSIVMARKHLSVI